MWVKAKGNGYEAENKSQIEIKIIFYDKDYRRQ